LARGLPDSSSTDTVLVSFLCKCKIETTPVIHSNATCNRLSQSLACAMRSHAAGCVLMHRGSSVRW
jgi:hypothetical protein